MAPSRCRRAVGEVALLEREVAQLAVERGLGQRIVRPATWPARAPAGLARRRPAGSARRPARWRSAARVSRSCRRPPSAAPSGSAHTAESSAVAGPGDLGGPQRMGERGRAAARRVEVVRRVEDGGVVDRPGDDRVGDAAVQPSPGVLVQAGQQCLPDPVVEEDAATGAVVDPEQPAAGVTARGSPLPTRSPRPASTAWAMSNSFPSTAPVDSTRSAPADSRSSRRTRIAADRRSVCTSASAASSMAQPSSLAISAPHSTRPRSTAAPMNGLPSDSRTTVATARPGNGPAMDSASWDIAASDSRPRCSALAVSMVRSRWSVGTSSERKAAMMPR